MNEVPAALERVEPGEEETDSPAQLDAVVVNVRRRDEDPAAVPASVVVIGGDELRQMGASGFLDYAHVVPGLSWNDMLGCCGPKHVFRGISSGLLGEENSATQLYFDETPLGGHLPRAGLSSPPNPELLDIDHIEVLRGPQGTLFGASAMGGMIRIVPNEPDLDSTEAWVGGSVSMLYHGGTGYQAEGVGNLPFADGGGAMRVAAFQRRLDGWVDNDAQGAVDVNTNNSDGTRVALRFDRGALRTDFTLLYQRTAFDGFRTEQIDLTPYETATEFPESGSDAWSLFALKLDYAGDAVRVVSNTSYHDRVIAIQADFSPVAYAVLPPTFVPVPTYTTAGDSKEEFTQELRVLSLDAEPWGWVVGAFYQQSDRIDSQDIFMPGFDALNGGIAASFGFPDQFQHGVALVRHDETALFADVTASWQAFEFGFGARWFQLEQRFDARLEGMRYGGLQVQDGGSEENGVTPRLSGRWAISPKHNIYATIAEGFRPGGSNATALITSIPACLAELALQGYTNGPPAAYSSDGLVNREVGAKTNWLDRRLSINVAIFDIAWDDMQTRHFLQSCGQEFFENAGDATSRGGELDLVAYPTTEIRLDLNAAYTDARFDQDVPNLGAQRGERIAGVPYYTAAFAATWFYSGTGLVRFDYRHIGEAVNPYDGFGGPTVDPYGYANVALVQSAGPWEFTFRVTNLADSAAVVSNTPFFTEELRTRLQPRAITLGARFEF